MAVRLTNRDLKEVLDLGQTLLVCRGTEELRRVALDRLENIFRCESANFFLTQQSGLGLDLPGVMTRGITRANLDSFGSYYYRFDPFLRHFPSARPVLTMDQVASPQGLVHTEYYNDFLRPQAIHHQLTMSARVEGRVAGVVALFRPKKRSNFTPAEVAKADLCTSYLSGALAKVIHADRSYQLGRVAETLAASLPCRGVVVADSRLKVIYRNHLADQVLGRTEDQAMLPLVVTRACQEMIGPESPEIRQFLLETDSPGGAIEVMVRRVNRATEEPLLVISFDSEGTGRDWMTRLAARGVSRREMEVVHLVGQGLTNQEVARRLYISQHTVENHLKAVFRKLAVRNRASLTGLLNSRK
jgi:DNA-binding CsgD family transcriptional regulator